jgi:hypothetical protein
MARYLIEVPHDHLTEEYASNERKYKEPRTHLHEGTGYRAQPTMQPTMGLPGGTMRMLLFVRIERQTETVTLRNVAGMEVPPFLLWFCAFASSTSSLWSSSTFPFLSAASKAFMVGP